MGWLAHSFLRLSCFWVLVGIVGCARHAVDIGPVALPAPRQAGVTTHQNDTPVEAEWSDPASDAFEVRMGGVHRDARAEQHMETIARRLMSAASHAWPAVSFRLLNNTELNAYSMPRRVYFTIGLWRRLEDDDAVAAAIAHELAHICADDSIRPRALAEREALQREMQADRGAIGYLQAAGFDPRALARLVELVADEQPEGWAVRRIAWIESLVAQSDDGPAVAIESSDSAASELNTSRTRRTVR